VSSDTLRAPHLLEIRVHNIVRIKLGYYTLPREEGDRPQKLLHSSAGTISVDPYFGTENARRQLSG
jgi:hypothetical protein